MKFTAIFMLVACLQVNATSYSQNVSLTFKSATLETVFKEIRKQTGFEFLYNTEMLENTSRVSLELKNVPLRKALEECFRNLPLTFNISERMIVVRPRPLSGDTELSEETLFIKITGRITDKNGTPLTGVNIAVKDSQKGTVTGSGGEFSLDVPGNKVTLVITYIGYKKKEIDVTASGPVTIVLEPDAMEMKDVTISTGVFTRKQESFTGSAVTVTREQLKNITNQNILQGLKVLDPSFVQLENNLMGSNPNQLPEFQMRGSSSLPDLKGEYTGNPNLPLFILDGFETTMERVYDLDINRVATITLLKDAAAKAIYGSRASNGVVVIETQRPAAGKMRLTYTGDLNITTPDLSSYDLTNATEKLQVEMAAGRYTSTYLPNTQYLLNQYNETYKDVAKGVNTYWLSQPVRTGVGQKHSVFLEGGDGAMRYGVDLSYNNITGAMKGSNRRTASGTINLSYQYKKLLFRNILTVSFNRSDDSPYGTFSQYSRLNPYWSPYDSLGRLKKILGQFDPVGSLGNPTRYVNPLYDASLGTKNFSKYTEIVNNLQAEWNIRYDLKLVARVGFSNKADTREDFYPASHTRYATWAEEDFYRRGEYTIGDGLNRSIKTDLTANYTKKIHLHQFYFNLGWNMLQVTGERHGFTAEGFLNDRVDNIAFARQYKENGRPTGTETTTREIGVLGALNYSYNDRYLLDLSVRNNGSSVYGANNRWGTFWSAGLGWNLHKEEFLRNNEVIKLLKLRGSIGYTGNQNFNPYQAMATYNYYTDVYYDNVVSAKLMALSNDNLKWQQTRDMNLGLDAKLGGRVNIRFDLYKSLSNNLLIDLSLPGSVGFSSYKENLGSLENTGFDGTLNYRAYSNPKKQAFLNIFISAATNKNKIVKLSNALDSYNNDQDKSGSTKPLVRYKEGQSTSAIWAVQSLGIDPVTGSEAFLSLDGKKTYTWDPNDQFAAAESTPRLNGSMGLNAEYRGFGFNMAFTYRYKAGYYNQTLVDRVENVDIQYNVDRRVFTDTWKNPGDVVFFKKISAIPTTTRATTRFIGNLNELQMTSLNVSYDFRNHSFLKNYRLNNLKATFYMIDVFRAGSIKAERGLDYPFARTFSFSLKANF